MVINPIIFMDIIKLYGAESRFFVPDTGLRP